MAFHLKAVDYEFMNIKSKLLALKDQDMASFQSKLTPGVDPDKFLGIRIPDARSLAKEFAKDPNHFEFYKELPHEYFDENNIHGLLISEEKDYDLVIKLLNDFLPYVDNWAVCDITSPKVFKKHKSELIKEIRRWCKSKHTYTCRFGIEMLMSHYLDDDFKQEYLEIPSSIKSDQYYVNMMIAWFFATSLAKQWDATIPYIEKKILLPWVHNKTIQKAKESFRINAEQKAYLNSLKIK